jgi:transcriptional regulator with XRE-family HTH domain
MANLPLLQNILNINFTELMKTKEEIAIKIGKKIRSLRTEQHLTIEQLALEAGMEYTQLSRIERGKINTSVYHLYLISRPLKISLSEIFEDQF